MKKIKSFILILAAFPLLSSFISCRIIFGTKGHETPETPENSIVVYTDGLTINKNLLQYTKEVLVEGTTVTGKAEYNPVYSWDQGKNFYPTEESSPSETYENWQGFFLEGLNVTLSSFIMGKYEVTQELYETVMGTNPSVCVSSDSIYANMAEGEIEKYRPVDSPTWYDACLFCNKLTKLIFGADTTELVYYEENTFQTPFSDTSDGTKGCYMDPSKKGYRLPTEAEWEYAARGGKKAIEAGTFKDFYSGKDISSTGLTDTFSSTQIINTEADEIGWYAFNVNTGSTTGSVTPNGAGWGTHQVGMKKANELGIYDMSGNVWEWCYDWYGKILLSGTVKNPSGPEAPVNAAYLKSMKGGSWNMGYTPALSVARKFNSEPDHSDGTGARQPKGIGFRIVRNAE